jgi:hypothetical protein
MHPFDKKRAYIITNKRTHYKTDDRGKTWDEFTADVQASIFREALTFHGGDPDRIIFNAMDCTGIFCDESVSLLDMYTWKWWLTVTDYVHYGWLLHEGQIFERVYFGLPLGCVHQGV